MKILITGGTGMIGSAFKNIKTNHELILVGSKDYDLRCPHHTEAIIEKIKPSAIIHLAARVGGVKGNSDYVADFFSENILINTNLLNAAQRNRVPKALSLLSTCVYPADGEPHQSNFGYAYAKRMLEVYSRAIRSQYGLKYITAVPNNVYGPKDNFDLENSHVIPAMIRKFYEAKIKNTDVVLWGTGEPLREFTYSTDIARALILLLENYEGRSPINIGTTREFSIKEVSEAISREIGFKGKIIWDTNMPTGQLKKPSSNKKFLDIFPNFCYTDVQIGLKKTCEWFIMNYPKVRGVNI